MKKGIVVAEFPAPYRVAVFEKLSEEYKLDIFFEKSNDQERSDDYTVKSSSAKFYILNRKDDKKVFRKACRNIKKYDFVLCYNAGILPGVYVMFCGILARVPCFTNLDGAFIRNNFIRDTLKTFMFSHAALCFSSGKVATDYFLHYKAKRESILLHNFTSLTSKDIMKDMISEKEKKNLRNKLGMQADDIYVISVGQFIKRKGYDILLSAWKQLNTKNNIHLILIGGGSEKKCYLEMIQQYNIQNVELYEFMPKERIFEYYKASDIFVLPTREDVWGLVINEAMACGLPIITTNRCIAGQEMLSGKNGAIYDFDNINELSMVLDKYIEDRELRINQGKENIIKMQGNTMENIALSHIENINNYFACKGMLKNVVQSNCFPE